MIKKLTINGLRGFGEEQELDLSLPNGDMGSGLTILVGSNNSGKSTVIEALRAFPQRSHSLPSFTLGRRNISAGDKVSIKVIDDLDNVVEIRSIRTGSSEVELVSNQNNIGDIFILPSRRAFNPFFQKNEFDRQNYTTYQIGFPPQRASQQDNFSGRLFNAEKNRDNFNKVLEKVINPIPDWTIDQNDNGHYFLKFSKGTISHSSEGVGEGIVSLFFIIDALYDSNPKDIVVIDEPELSLHPSLQKRLASLISEYSKERQILIATHSPYFIDLENLVNGTTIARVHQKENNTVISQISNESANFINRSLSNLYNPHVFGLDAKEVFFLEDRILLVEGQDDVIFYKLILDQLDIKLNGQFFGWGIGGADNMHQIAKLFDELGFEKVIGILDADREYHLPGLREQFENYNFFAITANDVRTKQPRKATAGVEGILNEQRNIRIEHLDATKSMFREIRTYLGNDN
ncbi:AAA family ATPase [Metabacillus sp. GX 13764]|uniref:ATP-dependent nuclease n=1 Tax=Metabacillus kandeliae TaxID=2900151 RepID=UPI001E35E844|nr:ATP-binding protein [Metabacillus kandeliae]MCD7032870.1 AAA family ATPase [Metabacillus kandeliae]